MYGIESKHFSLFHIVVLFVASHRNKSVSSTSDAVCLYFTKLFIRFAAEGEVRRIFNWDIFQFFFKYLHNIFTTHWRSGAIGQVEMVDGSRFESLSRRRQ